MSTIAVTARQFLAGAFVKAALKPARAHRVQLSWIKTVAERTLGSVLEAHVWLPEAEVRDALIAAGYSVRPDGLVRCSFVNPKHQWSATP